MAIAGANALLDAITLERDDLVRVMVHRRALLVRALPEVSGHRPRCCHIYDLVVIRGVDFIGGVDEGIAP
jgi:hypothetical protein